MKNSLSIFNSVVVFMIFPFSFRSLSARKRSVNGRWLKHEKQNNIKLVIDCKSLRLAEGRDTFSSLTYLVLVVSGGWSSWGAWCECTKTCGRGSQYRKRSCTKPGGTGCVGPSREYKSCMIKQCNLGE